jgi:hypothetical protein
MEINRQTFKLKMQNSKITDKSPRKSKIRYQFVCLLSFIFSNSQKEISIKTQGDYNII